MRLVVQCGFFSSLLVHLVAQRLLGEVFPLPLKIYSVDPTFVRCSNSNGIFVHRTNCSLFHLCSLGIHHVYSCLNGYFYNPSSQRCEEEFFSPFECRKMSEWNFYPIDELIIETNQSDYRKSFQSICVHRGIYPDVFDCSLFHICHDNSHHQIVRCPSGFHFDPKTSICLRSQLVDCQYERPMIDEKFRFQKVQCENSPDGTFLPMPKKIDEFFLCQSRRKIVQMKCKTGFFYNALTNSCENGPCLFDSTLCQNDGQCVDDPTIRRGFRCICSDLFNGEFCETSRENIELTSMSMILTENETTHVPFVDSFNNYPQHNSIAVFDDELSPSIDELFKLLFLVTSICVLFIAFIAIIYGFYRWIRLNRFSSSMTDSVSEWKILAEESKV